MRGSLLHRAESLAALAVPALTGLAMIVLMVMLMPIPALGQIGAVLPLMAVFYWTLMRPEALPPTLVFALGLLADLLAGLPVGLSAALLLLVHFAATALSRYILGGGFLVTWAAFALCAGLYVLAETLIVAALALAWPPLDAAALRMSATIALYPVICRLLLGPAGRLGAV